MKILLTAFDPFGGSDVNPAMEAVKLVSGTVAGVEIVRLEVPTVFDKSVEIVTAAIEAYMPDAVLCVGQAGGRSDLTVERVAINIDDARIPDNEGSQPIDRTICPDGAAAYFATLPIKAMVAKIREAGLSASVSNTAGTFVCNHLMYGVLHYLDKYHPRIRAGFLHVPFSPEQAALRSVTTPSMAVTDTARGIEAALAAIAEYSDDIHTVEGTIQ